MTWYRTYADDFPRLAEDVRFDFNELVNLVPGSPRSFRDTATS